MVDKSQAVRPITLGDAAVDGLLNGVIAGAVMGLYLALAALADARAPGNLLSAFDTTGGASPVAGLVLHLAVSGVYGAVFGLVWKMLRRAVPVRLPGWGVGAVFGLILLAIAETILLPGAPSLRAIPVYHFAVAHLLYGLTLGGLLARLF